MMRTKTDSNMLSFLYKPLCVVFLLISLFGLVWLRSGIVATAYELRTLEEKKMSALKDMKMLLAERANHMSLQKMSASFKENTRGNNVYASADSFFQNRVRVIHMKKNKGAVPYKASLEAGGSN